MSHTQSWDDAPYEDASVTTARLSQTYDAILTRFRSVLDDGLGERSVLNEGAEGIILELDIALREAESLFADPFHQTPICAHADPLVKANRLLSKLEAKINIPANALAENARDMIILKGRRSVEPTMRFVTKLFLVNVICAIHTHIRFAMIQGEQGPDVAFVVEGES